MLLIICLTVTVKTLCWLTIACRYGTELFISLLPGRWGGVLPACCMTKKYCPYWLVWWNLIISLQNWQKRSEVIKSSETKLILEHNGFGYRSLMQIPSESCKLPGRYRIWDRFMTFWIVSRGALRRSARLKMTVIKIHEIYPPMQATLLCHVPRLSSKSL